jgi:hypothetical protein
MFSDCGVIALLIDDRSYSIIFYFRNSPPFSLFWVRKLILEIRFFKVFRCNDGKNESWNGNMMMKTGINNFYSSKRQETSITKYILKDEVK